MAVESGVVGNGCSDWATELAAWLEPFDAVLRNKAQRKWAPVYVAGLIGPGERKSIQPMAERTAPGELQQLHNFVNCAAWEPGGLWEVLAGRADELTGGEHAVLVFDDTALVKQGRNSVGVAHQYCGQLGKKANCQAIVTATLARRETPVCVGLRLYMPQGWVDDPARRKRCGVPEELVFKTKWELAVEELDRLIAAKVRFGCVLADAGYGYCAAFRKALSDRSLMWAVGIGSAQNVYAADVQVSMPPGGKGRPRRHPVPSSPCCSAEAMIRSLGNKAFETIAWRMGTKGPLKCEFAAVRVCVADAGRAAQGVPLPGGQAWLICERRAPEELRYYLSNLPATASLRELAANIKARWVCEQMHQQMKEELGVDHFEGRSWRGLNHHLVLAAITFAFLQHLRLAAARQAPPKETGEKKRTRRTTAKPLAPGHQKRNPSTPRRATLLPQLRSAPAHNSRFMKMAK